MKYSVLIIAFLLASVSSFSQEESKLYVEVVGQATYHRAVEKYEGDVELSFNSYNSNVEGYPQSLEELENRFFEKAMEAGIEKSKLKSVDPEKYETQSAANQRIRYQFETTSEETFKKMIQLEKTLEGIYFSKKTVFFKPMNNKKELIPRVIANARKNAVIMAEAMEKKLGSILSISDFNYEQNNETSYYEEIEKTKYRTVVRFAVE